MTHDSPTPTWTSEQEEIFRIRQGFHVVSANAGTGKTATLAELVVRLYLEEAAKQRADGAPGHHLQGKEQEAVVRQLCAITFTRDAAKELDDRIYARFGELGIPPPLDPWGERHRFCRTIDSYVHRWMRRRLVVARLLKVDPDIHGSCAEKLAKLPLATRASLAVRIRHKDGEKIKCDPLIEFFRAWPWKGDGAIASMLFDILHREDEAAIPGLNASAWPEEFETLLSTLTPPQGGQEEGREAWGASFWTAKLAVWRAHQKEMRELADRFAAGELAGGAEHHDLMRQLAIWEEHSAARRDFFSILEIARSRGYHPVRAADKLAALAVLQELAASDHWASFTDFHNFALRLYAEKLRYGTMDHADFLTACVDTFEKSPELVERDREYPLIGIRAKNVLYDEVQDNSIANTRLFKVLCGSKSTPYLAVAVGDAKQAIYGFRGACSYGFGQMLESVKKKAPENIHHLTCSFRSLAKIVALGNECVMTLPSYKATVRPSHTVYPEPGQIVVAPPLATEKEEAEWVLDKIRELLVETTETVMVLHRNNLRDHPIVAPLAELLLEYPQRLQTLTIHRSKGLQAHHCFVLGMTATIMPDVRTSFTQMVNLLYVALTRPRKALYITAPYTLQRPNKDGVLEERAVGPSPFLLRLPTLCHVAQHAGWPIAILESGDASTKQAAIMLSARVGGKEMSLRRQWRQLWPHIPVKDADGDEFTEETGSAAPSAAIQLVQRRTLYEDGKLVLSSGPALAEGIREKVTDALRLAYRKNGQAPRLSTDEFRFALRLGWLEKPEGSKIWMVAPKFAALCDSAA